MKITKTITGALPNRPDQRTNMSNSILEIYWKSPKTLQGPCQMDFENHHVSYLFQKRKNTYMNRKVELSISYKDFHCFELMGFAHVRFSPFDFSKKSFKKLTCEKTRISKKPIKTNIISTFWPPKITTIYWCFFSDRPKTNHIQKYNKNIEKHTHTHTSSKTHLKPTKYQHFPLPGRSRGPPKRTKSSQGAPGPPPDTLRKLHMFLETWSIKNLFWIIILIYL